MINISCDFESRVLNTKASVKVMLPNQIDYMSVIEDYQTYYNFGKFKTLYLLHGAWDDAMSWIENTSVMRYAQNNNLALVLPSVGNSFYSDMYAGEDYFKFISEELIGFVRNMFPIADTRENSFIGGNSMGGYGAYKVAIKRPDLFSKAFSLSGALEIQMAARLVRAMGVRLDNVFENVRNLKGTENDIMVILEQAILNNLELPKLYQAVGLEDYMYKGNQEFRDKANQLNVPVFYEEEHGEHKWDFWDKYIERAISWCVGGEVTSP